MLRRSRTTLILIVLMVVGATGAAEWSYMNHHREQSEQSQSAAQGVTHLDGTLAPDFQMTDQNGKHVSLASLRGKTIVLTFLDPKCRDICPVIAQQFRLAGSKLGRQADDVIFLAVNVNAKYNTIGDVRRFTIDQHLDTLPHWHFLTGGVAELRTVWTNYGIYVDPSSSEDLLHSAYIYFIDEDGHERYLANTSHTPSGDPAFADLIRHYAQQTMRPS